jgi:hypothetical protein
MSNVARGVCIVWFAVFALSVTLPGSSLAQTTNEEEATMIESQMSGTADATVVAGRRFGLVGELMLAGESYQVNGEPIIIDRRTEILGRLRQGIAVDVRGRIVRGGSKIAETIIVQEPLKGTPEEAHVDRRMDR